MPNQRIVRCEVRRNPVDATSVRFIPVEIFGLWSYLMKHKHGFEVVETEASFWVDLEESPEMAYTEQPRIPVTEISLFLYSDPAGMFTRVARYFPTEDYERLKSIFLSHYLAPDLAPGTEPPVRERAGVWIAREASGL